MLEEIEYKAKYSNIRKPLKKQSKKAIKKNLKDNKATLNIKAKVLKVAYSII